MNGFSERDAVFLAEMGLGPLWQLRAAPLAAAVVEAAEADEVMVEEGAAVPAPVGAPRMEAEPRPAARSAPSVAPQPQAPRDGPPAAAPRPQEASAAAATPPRPQAPREAQAPAAPPRPAEASQPSYLPPGPRPLQPVAQSVSALAPGEDSAWDDAALPSDATPEEIAAMDWDQLHVAIAACRRCSACRDGRAPVPGTGSRQARWLVAAGASTAADEKARLPLAGDPGKLLDNMLGAVGMSRERDVYVTNLIKCRPLSPNGAERAPTPDEAAACRPYLERERALTGAATVLTLGQIAANTLLGRPLAEPLAGVRGQVHALAEDVALVALQHPGELLRRGTDKAAAWADLCRARRAHGRAG